MSDTASGDEHDHAPRLVQSADAVSTGATSRAPAFSLPNIGLGHYPELKARRAYADLYASSYSDSEEEDEEDGYCGDQSPMEAVVMQFERSAAKLPAQRVGAAKLGQMVYAHHRLAAERSATDSATDPPEANGAETPGPDLLQRKATLRAVRRRGTQRGVAKEEERDEEREEENTVPSAMAGRHSDDDTQPYRFRLDLPQAIDMQAGEEFNGLLAPGAYADDKQRAKADGGWLQRLVHRLRGDRQEREARLFHPTVFDPARKHVFGSTGDAPYIEHRPTRRSGFPFCCCAPRYCVAIGFVAVLVGAVLGFFAWPRVPSISISSLAALAPARVTYDEAQSSFGLHMPMRITYEIHSGNFYPLTIARVHVLGFDGVTGNKIVDTTLTRIRVPPLRMLFHAEPAAVHYLTSDMTDPALTDLFGKCAPRSATNVSNAIEGRPGALTIRFQIRVDVSNLAWVKQPVVTLNQNVECPE